MIDRAMRKSETGRYPATWEAMLRHVPQSVIEALTSAQLADLIDGMERLARNSRAIGAKEERENR